MILERLNRVLVDPQWSNIFPAARLVRLPTIASDHSPLLLSLHVLNARRKKAIYIRKLVVASGGLQASGLAELDF